MSLAKRFTELHGGTLYAESDGERKGSSFHCLIPADHESRQFFSRLNEISGLVIFDGIIDFHGTNGLFDPLRGR